MFLPGSERLIGVSITTETPDKLADHQTFQCCNILTLSGGMNLPDYFFCFHWNSRGGGCRQGAETKQHDKS